jgi:tetratricopeptide (TPR) repeat protein
MNNFELAKSLFFSGLDSFQKGDYLSAERDFRESLRNLPDRVSTMTNLASALIRLSKLDEANELCRKTISIDEGSAEAWLNLGLIARERSDYSAAAENFRRALDIDPDYSEARNNLASILKELERSADTAAGARQATAVSADDFESAKTLFLSGLENLERSDFRSAESDFRESLKRVPDEVSTLTNLAATLIKLGRLDEARDLCLKAISLDGNSAQSWLNLGLIDKEQSDLPAALEKFRRAADLRPDYAEAFYNSGLVLKDLDRLTEAVASIRQALAVNSGYADAHSALGSLLLALGEMEEAEASLRKGMELAPDAARPLIKALLYLPYRQDDPCFGRLEEIYAGRESLDPEDRVDLDFAMGKAMESVRQYDRSFGAYAEGNRLYYQMHPFDEDREDKRLERLRGLFTAELFKQFAALADSMSPARDEQVPVFIVGMPRSGTTLIEQILASHPALHGAGELPLLGELVGKARDVFNPEDPAATLFALHGIGREYLARVGELAPGARYVTDKMPGNYDHLGWIHLMLPHAKIIHATRNPMDTCFSCFAMKFEHGHEYCYDLEALGRHYLRYREYMTHWHTVLPPGRILDVAYEEVIDDTERQARRILDSLGLPWDSACLDFYKNKRTVKTASVTQVRKPIYKSSVARWKHFENHLFPLAAILKPVCE